MDNPIINPEYQQALDTCKEMGYSSIRDYVLCMAEDYGVPEDIARSLAVVYGYSELFDGFTNALEDYAEENME